MTLDEYLDNHNAHEGAEEPEESVDLDELSEALKPCPFCGFGARIRKHGVRYEVSCLNCDAVFYPDGWNIGAVETIVAWNERADNC